MGGVWSSKLEGCWSRELDLRFIYWLWAKQRRLMHSWLAFWLSVGCATIWGHLLLLKVQTKLWCRFCHWLMVSMDGTMYVVDTILWWWQSRALLNIPPGIGDEGWLYHIVAICPRQVVIQMPFPGIGCSHATAAGGCNIVYMRGEPPSIWVGWCLSMDGQRLMFD